MLAHWGVVLAVTDLVCGLGQVTGPVWVSDVQSVK